MDYCSMSNMCAFMQPNRGSWEHVYGAVLLNIAALFNHNPASIATNSSSRTDVNIFPNLNIANYACRLMNKSCWVNARSHSVEFVNHFLNFKLQVPSYKNQDKKIADSNLRFKQI